MSSKSTIILTSDNEHWYHDCQGAYFEDTSSEECIVLEFNAQHKIQRDKYGIRIIIESDTELYKSIKNL